MGRAPCCDKTKVKKGPWSPEEDATLKNYLEKYGTGGNWIALPSKAGLNRCGKSCRLRWLNYLRPDIRHGGFTEEEDNTICDLYTKLGSRWSVIASQLAGRTDNDVKNHWNTKLRKKLLAAQNHHTTITNHHHRRHQLVNNPILSPALVPKPESYNLGFSPLLTQNSPTMPEFPNTNYPLDFNNPKMVYDPIHYSLPQVPELSNHNISSSSSQEGSSFSWSGNGDLGGFSMECGYELINGGWSQETGIEIGNYYDASLVNSIYSDVKPQGLLQSVTNQY